MLIVLDRCNDLINFCPQLLIYKTYLWLNPLYFFYADKLSLLLINNSLESFYNQFALEPIKL